MADLNEPPTEHHQHHDSGGWKTRAWPGMAGLAGPWLGLRGNANTSTATTTTAGGPGPGTSLRRALLRRVAMWTILLLRVIVSVFMIVGNTLGSRVISIVVGGLLLMLNLLFVVWCLSVICRAGGYRIVLCVRVGRNHLDVFLVICALLHVVLIIGMFTFLGRVGANIFWFALWVLIAIYGLICTTRPDSVA